MILYQMAKRLEQRKKLHQSINQTGGEAQHALVTQKEQVEEQLQTQATIWTEDKQDEFLLAGVTADNEWTQQALY